MPEDKDTEQRILEAAEEVFHEKGYSGARMREIADRAGTNKGLLHYYFKTKDALFDAIFGMALRKMVSKIRAVLELEMPLEQKLDMIVDQYMTLIMRNPSLPRFVLNELHNNADQFIARHVNDDVKRTFNELQQSIQREANEGSIRNIDARQLLMNLVSMVVFPFIARPMMQVVFGVDNQEFKQLLSKRKEHIKEFIKRAIAP